MVKFSLGDLVVPLTGIRRGVCGYVTTEDDDRKPRSRVTVSFPGNKHGSFLSKNLRPYEYEYAPPHLANDEIYENWSQRHNLCKIEGKKPWRNWSNTRSNVEENANDNQGGPSNVETELPSEMRVEEMVKEFQKLVIRVGELESRLKVLEDNQ